MFCPESSLSAQEGSELVATWPRNLCRVPVLDSASYANAALLCSSKAVYGGYS